MEFKEQVLIIGYGSVSKCTLPLLFKHLKVPYSKVTIIDFIETDQSLKHWTDKGVKFCREEITPRNMSRLLEQHVAKGASLKRPEYLFAFMTSAFKGLSEGVEKRFFRFFIGRKV